MSVDYWSLLSSCCFMSVFPSHSSWNGRAACLRMPWLYPLWIGVLLLFSHFPRQSSHIILTNHLDCAWKGGFLSWGQMDNRGSQMKKEWWQYQGILPIHVSELVAIGMSLTGHWGCLPLQVVEKSYWLFLTHRVLNTVVNFIRFSKNVPASAQRFLRHANLALVPYTEHKTGKSPEKAQCFFHK